MSNPNRPNKNVFLGLHVRSLVVGAVAGAALAIGTTSLADQGEKARVIATGFLYALAELAVETETNAARIVELRDRVADLEEMVNELRMDGR